MKSLKKKRQECVQFKPTGLKMNEMQRTSYCFGKTPYQTFVDSMPIAKEKYLDEIKEENNKLVMSDEAETGSAGGQLVRNNPTDRNSQEVDAWSTSTLNTIPGNHA